MLRQPVVKVTRAALRAGGRWSNGLVVRGTRRCTLCAVGRKRRVTLWATDICARRLCRSSEEITRIAILLTPRRATAGARRAFHGTFTTDCRVLGGQP